MTYQDDLSEFAEYVVDEEGWHFAVRDLIGAADALWPAIEHRWRYEDKKKKLWKRRTLIVGGGPPDPRGVYLMLMAYALENICKVLLVRQNGAEIQLQIERNGLLPNELTTHNLATLVERIGYRLTEDERTLAARLHRASVWSARYPVPKRADHSTLTMTTEAGEEIIPEWHSRDDIAAVGGFVARVDQFVKGCLADA